MQLMMGGRMQTLLREKTGMQHLTPTTLPTSPVSDNGAQCQLIEKTSGLTLPQIPLFTAEKVREIIKHANLLIIFVLKSQGQNMSKY